MPHTDLIIVDANDETDFTYTDFATGQDATFWPIIKGNQLSWVVRSSGNLTGYRIDFSIPKGGSPFAVMSIKVPGGGISTPYSVVNLPSDTGNQSMAYTVTLSDLRMDDPQVVPYENLVFSHLVNLGVPPLTTIQVTVDGANNVQLTPDPIALPPGARVMWSAKGQSNLVITFDSPPGSPFVNTTNPVPGPDGNSTFAEKLDNRPGDFPYTASVSGANPVRGTLTVQPPPRRS